LCRFDLESAHFIQLYAMNIFNTLWLSIGALILSAPAEKSNTTLWKVSQESVVEVVGSTNVNNFQCNSLRYAGEDQLISVFYPDKKVTEWSGEVVLLSKNFDCYNNIMTKDFQETVLADEHPEIKVRFIQLKKHSSGNEEEQLDGQVEITLAGVTKRYPISCFMMNRNGGKTHLRGQQTLYFSEFGLEAPVKFLGTVKVKNSITVNFGLVLVEKG
jgi:hypothetical protein